MKISTGWSGDGTMENVGVKVSGKFQCDQCRQKFDTQADVMLHCRFTHGCSEPQLSLREDKASVPGYAPQGIEIFEIQPQMTETFEYTLSLSQKEQIGKQNAFEGPKSAKEEEINDGQERLETKTPELAALPVPTSTLVLNHISTGVLKCTRVATSAQQITNQILNIQTSLSLKRGQSGGWNKAAQGHLEGWLVRKRKPDVRRAVKVMAQSSTSRTDADDSTIVDSSTDDSTSAQMMAQSSTSSTDAKVRLWLQSLPQSWPESKDVEIVEQDSVKIVKLEDELAMRDEYIRLLEQEKKEDDQYIEELKDNLAHRSLKRDLEEEPESSQGQKKRRVMSRLSEFTENSLVWDILDETVDKWGVYEG